MSIQKEFALYVPIKGESVRSVGNVVQNDIGGNKIIIRLTDGKNPIDLTGYTNITFSVLKPDGTYVVDSLGDRIAVVDALQGAISVVLHDNAINMAGSCMATIEVFSGATRVTSARLSFVVTADLTAGADPASESSYPVLLNLMVDVSEMKASVEAAEALRVTAETGRVTAESGRTTAEGLRVTAEEGRAAAESTRASSETARSDAEGLRAAAETTRLSNESGRVSAESGRVSAESSRATAESGRASAESTRVGAESNRVTAESSRSSAEGIRASAEITRLGNENTRSSAEEGRVLAENSRVSAEGLRNTAESDRVSAEGLRVSAENLRSQNETARQFVGNYDPATAYVIGNHVVHNGSSYRCIADCTGVVPTNTANWILVASRGLDGEGSGDMLAAVYDPTGKAADVYDMSNMVEGVINKIMTATERTKLATIEENATNYQHPANHPPSIIMQDASNRFVSDTEKATWSGKQDALGSGTTSQFLRGDKTWQAVTKANVGLGSVENYGVATQAEAEAGTVDNKYMTPLKTAQAIALEATARTNADNALAAQVNSVAGLSGKTTVFNADGSITETRADGGVLVTVFNADGTITETLTKDSVVTIRTTTFSGDTITEVIS